MLVQEGDHGEESKSPALSEDIVNVTSASDILHIINISHFLQGK